MFFIFADKRLTFNLLFVRLFEDLKFQNSLFGNILIKFLVESVNQYIRYVIIFEV